MHKMLLEKKVRWTGTRRLEEVPVAEDVFGVHVVLDGLEHPHADIGDGVSHPLLPKFPH